MAKGFKQGGMDILVWEVFRGFGRQTGREAAKTIGKQIKKRVLDDSSSHRKLVSRFVLPGTFAPAKNRMYGLIDSFYNEYVTTNAFLQSSIYLQDDIQFIERKIEFIDRLIDTEAQERAYEKLGQIWSEYKQAAINKK
tara:strand:- start:270 stop:683 length:414 start_codon:yes stop_codon:yes gene_type:complete